MFDATWSVSFPDPEKWSSPMKNVLLWMLGVPLSVLVVLNIAGVL